MTATALSDLADVEADLGRVDAAREHFDSAIKALYALDSDQLILALRSRALFKRNQRDHAGALADFEEGYAQCLKRKPDHVVCQVLRVNRAGHIARMGRGEEALREADAVLAELKRMQREGDNEYAQALESRALALQAVGRAEEAVATQNLAIERYTAVFGADHREVQRAKNNLAKLRE